MPNPDQLPPVARIPLAEPSPLGDGIGPGRFPTPPPAPVLRAALSLRKALIALADRVVPAEAVMFERSCGVMQTSLIASAARLGVADALDDGPKTAAELATRLGADAEALHRSLRALSAMGVFSLSKDGRFSNNRLSRGIRSGSLQRVREWAQYVGSQTNVIAWLDLPRTIETGKSAFERVFGESVWDWFDGHPDEREMFAHGMMGITTVHAPIVAGLFPFSESCVVCDVGGGRGTLLSELLVRHPHLRGMLCDAQGVLDSARDLLSRRGLIDRVELRPSSFFEGVPGGADTYVLKNVLHDWDDERSLVILRNVRKAMAPGSRLLVVESLVEPNDAGNLGVLGDAQMLIVCSDGRERSEGELRGLLREAGFSQGRAFHHPVVGVVEGVV